MTDEALLGYFSIHSRTPRALFAKEHFARLLKLAGIEPFNVERAPAFVAVREDVADPLVERARWRMRRSAFKVIEGGKRWNEK